MPHKRHGMASAAGAPGNQDPEPCQLANEDYTVGWICALTTEYVAAQVFLDEKHAPPAYIATHDNNDYTLGCIGKHNVVIAVLPGGEYGTASAAGVARDMLHTFPNIRIGLMVGIGGGAPSSKNDIRLGDVVVSEPKTGLGGVFQYDFGKNIQDQPFRSTRFLAPPPPVLLTAISGLRAEYEIDGHTIRENIEACLVAKKRLRKKYSHPDAATDRLYQSNVVHPLSEASCASCGSDASSVIMRPVRDEDADDPTIHYGLIASANQLMKDAKLRDQYANERDILCFEMEAGGLMNHFPCLVIRGICDYSDTHKNKEWQGYAAMTAAAYAKDLLKRISPNKVEAEKKLSEMIENISDTVRTTDGAVARIESNLRHMEVNRENKAILDWLTPVHYASRQNECIRMCQAGTGLWLLNSPEFQTWLQSDKRILFCPGIPGAGKTILTALVVDSLCKKFRNNTEVGIAYVYCDFQRKVEQNADNLLLSLLQQLSHGKSHISTSVQNLYNRHKITQTRPSRDEISRTLQLVVKSYSRVFVIIDALDECQLSGGCRKKFLSELFSLQRNCKANVFATSRFVPEIIAEFSGSMSLEIQAKKDDVRRYLKHHIAELPSVVRNNPQLQEDIITGISESIDGMFLLAQIYLRSLNKPTVKAIKTTLKGFQKQRPGSDEKEKVQILSAAYDETMKRIATQGQEWQELAMQVLSWIISAERPLTASELQCALAVELTKSELDMENIPQVEDMVSACAGLVTVDDESGIIRLVHYTTQEYFEQNKQENGWFANAQTDMMKTCVTYLSLDQFNSGPCQTDQSFELRLETNRLYDYAANNWGHHARRALALCPMLMDFLGCKKKLEASIQALMALKGLSSGKLPYCQDIPRQMTGLHLAAYFGVEEAVKAFLQKKVNVCFKDSYGRTPLFWAAVTGHDKVVKVLLEISKEDVGSTDINGLMPISYAAENGYDAVLMLLLSIGKVDVESKDIDGRTPLSYAAENGHDTILKLLIATGEVDVESEDRFHGTPLSYAAENGHDMTVRLLIKIGKADPRTKGKYKKTPLAWAAENGHNMVVKLLLEAVKADIQSNDKYYWAPLSWASKNGHATVVKMLLEMGTTFINLKNIEGRTPLSWSSENGHDTVVKLLLKTGKTDVESKDRNGRTPLSWAAGNGHDTVVKLLLEIGKAVVEPEDVDGWTPLPHAAANGHDTVVKLLLNIGTINVNFRDCWGQTPFSCAVKNGHESVVKLLLETGKTEIEFKDLDGWTPLLCAADNGNHVLVKLLLETGKVDVESIDADGRTPLSCAVANKHDAVVKLLLDAIR